MKVGTEIVAKVGCNEVKAVITEAGDNGIMARSHKSGKEFRVKTILQVTSAPEAPPETPKPEKKLSLFSAAIKVMETGPAGQTYSVKELVTESIAQGLWTPGAGKTPDMTLYAAILRDIATKHNLQFNRLTIKDVSTRWGSCSSLRNVNLSLWLLLLPSHLIDYVICHELCHLKELNHSPAFWAELDKLCGGTGTAKRLDKELSVLERTIMAQRIK